MAEVSKDQELKNTATERPFEKISKLSIIQNGLRLARRNRPDTQGEREEHKIKHDLKKTQRMKN